MPQPNFILIVTDDMSYEQMRMMPQLFKRIASTGVVFSRAFTATPLCQTARASYFTGQYSHNHGVIDNGAAAYAGLSPNAMLAKRLQLAGYYTSHVGKYLNSYAVADGVIAGWNDWYAFRPHAHYTYEVNNNGAILSKGTAREDYSVSVVTSKAVSVVASATEPFFLHVGYNSPHDTGGVAVPHPDYLGVIPSSREFPKRPNFNPVDVTGKPANISSQALLDGTAIAGMDAFWRGQLEMMLSVDRSIQAIMDALVAAGKDDNTYVIFVSDNGQMHGEWRIAGGKIVPYEPTVHIPLIISGPSSVVAQNKACSRLVSHIDLAPTIYALSGATSSLTMDGLSLLPLLENPLGPALRDELLIEWVGAAINPAEASAGRPMYGCIRTERLKYIEYDTGEVELYDLVADPYELVNLSADPAYTSQKSALAASLASAADCTGAGCVL